MENYKAKHKDALCHQISSLELGCTLSVRKTQARCRARIHTQARGQKKKEGGA